MLFEVQTAALACRFFIKIGGEMCHIPVKQVEMKEI